MRLAQTLVFCALLAAWLGAPALAQPAGGTPPGAQAPATQTDPPPQLDTLLDLLADPALRDWIAQQRPPAAPVAELPPVQEIAASFLTARLVAIQAYLGALARALPGLPDELAFAFAILQLEFEEEGLLRVVLLILGFAGIGFGAEWLFGRATAGIRPWMGGLDRGRARERLQAAGMRLVFGVGQLAAFATGSLGFFLVFDWPLLLREIVVGYLAAFLALRLAGALGRFVLVPPVANFSGLARFRLLPMSDAAASFWFGRLRLAVAVLAFGWVTVNLLGTLGLSPTARQLVANAVGLVLLGVGLDSVWRRPQESDGTVQASGGRATNLLFTLLLSSLWLCWAAGATGLFALLAVAAALPASIGAAERVVDHLLRPGDAAAGKPSVYTASIGRGVRALLIIAAILVLAGAWGIDLGALNERDTLATRLFGGGLKALVIVLVADFLWHLTATAIDRRIAEAQHPHDPDTEEARRASRLRTLLPIVRNMMFAVMVVVVALMALSALGIEIAPLVAGAGVVGVAVGFGAQTLVKDIISGMFYLFDDAFRVGEYIESGAYKGTVESFSLRSIKLRHHRGPLATVPFGELGAVQNMSRDWVINKLSVGVTYDTDIDRVKPIIKKIGKTLAADPEFQPYIIEPLKMQGVEQFGDFAIEIRLKMKTKPGKQFAIRRRAFAMIKKAFDENGIKFAYPTVQVAGGNDAAGAVAKQALALVQPQAEPQP